MRYSKELPLALQSATVLVLWILWAALNIYAERSKPWDCEFADEFRVYSLLWIFIPLAIELLGLRFWYRFGGFPVDKPIASRLFCLTTCFLTVLGIFVLLSGVSVITTTLTSVRY